MSLLHLEVPKYYSRILLSTRLYQAPVDLSLHPGDLLQLLRLLILPLARLLLGKHVLRQLGKVLAFRLKQALSPLLVIGIEFIEIV